MRTQQLFGIFISLLLAGCIEVDQRKPNVVFILTDDLGWRDLSCYGSTFYETPNIDKLAEEGMRFTDAYAASCVCSPTRASLLTGKYPATLHLTDWIAGLDYPYEKLSPPEWTRYLPHEEYTLAEAFRDNGYKTICIGKWHLGKVDNYPVTHGFDKSIASSEAGGPGSYFYPYRNQSWATPDLEGGEEGEYLTDRLTDEAIKWMTENREESFFLYLSYFNPHRPTQAKKEHIERFIGKVKNEDHQKNPVNAGMIFSLDENIGRIVAKMDELGLSKNTLLIFYSDNGGNHYADTPQKTSNWPLREGKGSVYEGGIRVPLIVRWPDHISAGTVSHVPVTTPDFYPTLLDIAGIDYPEGQSFDGKSIASLLNGTGKLNRDAIFWHYPHYHHGGASPHGVIRKGDYKLIEFFEDNTIELYNISEDISEQNNLAEILPDKVLELRSELEKWRGKINAQMPIGNTLYNEDSTGIWKFHTEELW